MKKNILILIALLVFSMSCSKGTSTPTPPPEPVKVEVGDIAFKIEVDSKEVDYTTTFAALSSNQVININVTSMPFSKDGVTIDLLVKKDLDNSVVSSSSISSSNATTNALTIQNLSPGVICTVTLTVTAKTLDTKTCNCYKTLIKSFKISRK